LIIDIALLSFVKNSIRKKNKLLKGNKPEKKSIMSKDGGNYEKRIKIMIILNGLIQSVFHSPDLFVAIFMATTDSNLYKSFDRAGINQARLDLNFIETHTVTQYWENNSLFINLLSILSDIIYISSYSFNFFLYYNFNALFQKSFKSLFLLKSSTKKI
jgi:hypothetical protein